MFHSIFNQARANIKGGKEYPNLKGTVSFKETKEGVLVTAKINGLPRSTTNCKGKFFGFHIHSRKFLYWKYGR